MPRRKSTKHIEALPVLTPPEGPPQESIKAVEKPKAPERQPLVPDTDFVDFPTENLSDSQKAFLIGFLMWGTQTRACVETQISPFTVEKWKKESKDFLTAYKLIEEAIGDIIEDRAIQLAMKGNDKILSKLLSGFKPQKYGKKVEVGGPAGEAINTFADLARRYFDDGKSDNSNRESEEESKDPA
jgi:hypothetical protein